MRSEVSRTEYQRHRLLKTRQQKKSEKLCAMTRKQAQRSATRDSHDATVQKHGVYTHAGERADWKKK
jgi:hypothetical protein